MKRERRGVIMLGIIKRFWPLSFTRIVLPVCALAVVAMAALPERANAQALFATSKKICIGVPDPITNNTCPPAPLVGVGQPVFYVISVTNPPGQPPQQITMTEQYPAPFAPGAIACTDQSNAPVTVAINGPTFGPFNLPVGATITCTIAGSFSAAGPANNIVNVANNESLPQNPAANTTVATTTQLSNDLALTKSVSPSPIGVGTANPLPATVTYTVTIKNNGPAVDVGHFFVLHDTLALLPNSMPLYATVVAGSFTCNATVTSPATDCLDTAAMNAMSWTQQLIGTMAPHSMFDWSFPPSPTPGFHGHMEAGATITLTWKVLIEKLPTLSCVKSTTANGLKNQAFFTLTNADGTAVNDTNSANNTASTPLTVNLAGNVDPNCGDGQLTLKKTQVIPNPLSQALWGMQPWTGTGPAAPPPLFGTVTYDITIKNTAMPAQSITILGGDLQDFVIQGIGTPPFTRTFVDATCLTSVPALICATFNPGGGGIPPLPPAFPSIATQTPYTFYGQEQLGWNSKPNKALTFGPNDSATIRIKFNYYGPDCDTVPNVNPKLIHNKAKITYMATPVGAALGSAQDVQYIQVAIAPTKMASQQACKFVVTKTLHPGSPKTVEFGGPPLVYDVTFKNNDVSRNIGTVMDSVRITNPTYATQVPFKSSWVCTQTGGVTPLPIPAPPVNGTAMYTGSPAQGSPIFQFTNLYFNNGAQLTCTVTVTVDRPLPNNPNCSMDQAYLENMALMDVTHPFNTNVPWPPSGVYVPNNVSNPTPQNKNWATRLAPLPKCYNVNINKAASVNGIPTSANAWTSPNGPSVNYAITVTNTGTSGVLTGSGTSTNWNGILVSDIVASPYGTNQIKLTTAGSCPGPWCTPLIPTGSLSTPASNALAGVSNLPAANSGTWGLTLLSPFTAGTYIKNCASVNPAGTFTGPDYYSNYDPANPPASSCVQVPVLQTADLNVRKTIVNATGHALNMPSTTSGITVGCQNYPLLSSGNLNLSVSGMIGFPNGNSLNGVPGVIHNVPVAPGETCTVTEPTLPAIPPGACGKDTVAYWDTTISPQPINITTGPNLVTVTNTLRCRPNLSVTKVFVDATGSSVPITPPTFNVNVACNPLGIPPTTLGLTPPATATTSSSPPGSVLNIPVTAGETCTVTESAPPIPTVAQHICSGSAYWDPPTFTPSQTISISATGQNAVTVTNTLRCMIPIQIKFQVIKHLADMTPGGANHPVSPYTVTLNCSPVSSPASVNLTVGTPQSILAPAGAVCTPTESPLPVPAAATHACTGAAPGIAHWETPAFVPASFTVTSAGPQLIHVFNVLRCGISNSPGTLTVLKQVTAPAGIAPPSTTFSIGVQCGTQSPTAMALSANGSQTIVVSPASNCAVSETLPPNFPTSGCPSGIARWLPPTYTPSASVTVNFGTAAAVVVNNSFQCIPIPPLPVTPPKQ